MYFKQSGRESSIICILLNVDVQLTKQTLYLNSKLQSHVNLTDTDQVVCLCKCLVRVK